MRLSCFHTFSSTVSDVLALVAAKNGCDTLCPVSIGNRSLMQHQVIEFYQQNLQLARETGNRRDEMSALASLGRAFEALEERVKAIEFYEQALNIAAELGDGRAERQAIKHLHDARNPQTVKTSKATSRAKKTSSRTTGRKATAKPRRKSSKNQNARKASASKSAQPHVPLPGSEE